MDRTNTTNTGTQTFDENYTAEYNGSTINYNVAETLLSCDPETTVTATSTFPCDPTTTHTKVTIVYDDGGADEWTRYVTIDVGTTPQVITHPTLPGQLS